MEDIEDEIETGRKSWFAALRGDLRKKILTGIGVMVPLVVTFLALRLVFLWLDSLAQPLIKGILSSEDDIPGLGIVLTFVVIWLAGTVGGNVVGRRIIGHGDEILAKLPLIGSIYSPVKQFIDNVSSAKSTPDFRRVVLAEYPADDRWILGFATGEVTLPDEKPGRCVFVPTSPNPATGWMVIFPKARVVDTDLSVEEAMRLIVSGGIVIPEKLGRAYTTNEVDFPGRPSDPETVPSEADDSESRPPTHSQTGRVG